MRRIAGCGLLVALVIANICAGSLAVAAETDELDRLRAVMPSPDTSGQGMHSDFWDEPIGRFMDLLGAGAITEARALQPQACAAWRTGRNTSPLSGRLSVQGAELSLDRICGLAPPASR